jgi:hypothetical protein
MEIILLEIPKGVRRMSKEIFRFRVTSEAAELFASTVKQLFHYEVGSEEYEALCYVMAKTYHHRRGKDPIFQEEDYVNATVLSSKWMLENFKNRNLSKGIYQMSDNWKHPFPSSILELVRNYNVSQKFARAYRIKDEFLQKFIQLSTRDRLRAMGKEVKYVNLYTLKPMDKPLKSVQYDANRNPIGFECFTKQGKDFLMAALKSLAPLPYNKTALELWIAVQKLPTTSEQKSHQIRDKAMFSFITTDSSHEYLQNYSACYTGRIYEQGCGFQGSRKEVKSIVLFDRLFYNYDLETAHKSIILMLINHYEKQQPDVKPLLKPYKRDLDFISTEFMANQLNLPKEDFKKVLYAYMYSCCSMYCKPVKEFIIDDLMRVTFKYLMRPIKAAINKLYEYIQHDPNCTVDDENFKSEIVNACGGKLVLSEISNGDRKKRIIAHIIQGAEKKFILSLILKCKDAGIKVYADEHDGFITAEPVPEELVSQVKHETGYNLKLVRKDFPNPPAFLYGACRAIHGLAIQRAKKALTRFGMYSAIKNPLKKQKLMRTTFIKNSEFVFPLGRLQRLPPFHSEAA